MKNTIAVIATPADEESFRDDRVGYHMPSQAFNVNINSTLMLIDALCAQGQQYCMRHNGVLLCRKAVRRALAKDGPSPWSRAAPCSYPGRCAHFMSACVLCNRQLARQRRANQCMSFHL